MAAGKEPGTALYPANPLPGSQSETEQAVRDLESQNPGLAAQLTRQHLERNFNEATQGNMTGPNQWGGAKFFAQTMGNPQQAQNVRAGLAALPGAPSIDPLMEAMKATGFRNPMNSATSFNERWNEAMAKGSNIGNALAYATSPKQWLGGAYDLYGRYKLGANQKAMAQALMGGPAFFDMLERARRVAPTAAGAIAQRLLERSAITPPALPALTDQRQ
jgi:hypothetical protein